MTSLKQIKLKRKAVLKTQKVTRAMEAVSAVKMRKTQKTALDARGFAFAALKILLQVSGSDAFSKHPLARPNKSNKVGIFLITSDKGLAGSLNSAILKEVANFTSNLNPQDVVVFAIGKRGYEFAKRAGFEVVHFEENKKDFVSIEKISEFSRPILNHYKQNNVGQWYLIYTNFISTFEQKPQRIKLLPLSVEDYKQAIVSIVPEKGMFSELKEEIRQIDTNQAKAYKYESESEDIVSELLPMLVDTIVFHGMLEAKASEHSARMVAMKSATDKAKELARDLLLAFNKARQAAITREVSEITSGIEAMKD